jgi:hypothetical protein
MMRKVRRLQNPHLNRTDVLIELIRAFSMEGLAVEGRRGRGRIRLSLQLSVPWSITLIHTKRNPIKI